ncbi:FxsA family protein [Saccharopolyspora rhizosphaerae]|uniref:FxsA family protein n=1 Tax=Saccharopolyspora rhizosphaerae TaxID=2492662 RepID=A0A426JY61_9PSEU|nr:FxsA family protein [Saccharopolyspora rhizosphaerae]RRO18052.1 FxsA family protein [Saccharopolyspora rhizosphaerae]
MPILVLLLIAGVAELAVLVALGQAIGLLPTIGLLVLAAVLGSWLLRREGRRTLGEFREAARLRRPPEREISDGMLIAAGGLLIVLPGFLSDVAGLLLLLPPTRALVRKRMMRAAEERAKKVQDQVWLHQQRFGRGGGRSGDFIDGEVVDETDDPPSASSTPIILPPQSARAERIDEPPQR